MKQLQLEKLQLLCWSRRRETHSASENRRDIVHRGWGMCRMVYKHSEPVRGNAILLSAVEAFTGRRIFLQAPLNGSQTWQGFEDLGLEEGWRRCAYTVSDIYRESFAHLSSSLLH